MNASNSTLSLTKQTLTFRNKALRGLWGLVWLIFYRPSPVVFHGWRRCLLRCFGAVIEKGAHPYPSSKIWAPWNLTMREHSCLSHGVICYNVSPVYLGRFVTISQYSHLCTASHDYTYPSMPLISAAIRIEDYAWITADVFVGPGVTVGRGAVVNARSAVFSDVDPWTVAKGYPAVSYKKRVMKEGYE